jgi:molybdopterin-guanine dinucleotide biosynthesis protein A
MQCASHWRPDRDGLKYHATAIVLAGGLSSRMGRDKALLEIDGAPLIERLVTALDTRFSELLVSVRHPSHYPAIAHRKIADEVAGEGPLMAIASSLAVSRHDLNFIVSCDIPELPFGFIERLLDRASEADGAVAINAEGRIEPLFAVYRKSLLPSARRALSQGLRRVAEMYTDNQIREVRIPPGVCISNLNTPSDYETYCRANAPLTSKGCSSP